MEKSKELDQYLQLLGLRCCVQCCVMELITLDVCAFLTCMCVRVCVVTLQGLCLQCHGHHHLLHGLNRRGLSDCEQLL